MIRYRPFRNSDPPALVAIWRRQPPLRGLVQPATVEMFERYVFSKPYFDRHGLIVAEENGQVVGFGHAGFSASDDGSRLMHDVGVTCLVMVSDSGGQVDVGRQLLIECERYLTSRGAQTLLGGAIHPADPFYLGLYGGSELPGVLVEHRPLNELFTAAGYVELTRTIALECQLHRFRPLVNRQQLQARRQYQIEVVHDPPPANWWQICAFGMADRTQFILRAASGTSLGRLTLWDMDAFSRAWKARTMGLIQLEIHTSMRRQGLATFLIGEALRHVARHGVQRIEMLTLEGNAPVRQLCKKLGFREVDQGIVYRKPAPEASEGQS